MEQNQIRKKKAVTEMFDNISGTYDFLNHFLSFGIDRSWRSKAVQLIPGAGTKPKILDVATGTADMAIAALKVDPDHVTGIDVSLKMLERGREKIRLKGISGRIELLEGDSENIPFGDNTFDVAMVAFGVRNFTDPLKGLEEMTRVVKEGGMVIVLEFSRPQRSPFRQIYHFYFLNILPLIGKLFSKNKKAYTYLPESVMQFPDNEHFKELMNKAGLSGVIQKRLSGGIASIYTGIKHKTQ